MQREISVGGFIFLGLLLAAFVGLVVVFAFQTYFLVDALFPADNIFMKWVTVFSFDGCCLIYTGLDLFYPAEWRGFKILATIMWGITFFGSLMCTIAYMNLSSDHLLHTLVDTNALVVSYAVVTIVFSGNIVAITFMLKGEYKARQAWKTRPRPIPAASSTTRELPAARVYPATTSVSEQITELQELISELQALQPGQNGGRSKK